MELKPGYKQTEVGVIPSNWKVETIANCATIKTGGRNTQDRVDDGKYPFFVRSSTVERINSYSYDGEAVLTAGDGVGTGKIFHYINGKFDLHQRVYKISDFHSRVDGFYFYLYFSSHFYSRIMQMTAKSSVDSVRRDMIANMPIPLPPLPEQRAISQALGDVDALLTSLIQLIAKKRDLKQAAMQQLLTGETRLPGFTGEWEVRRLGDLGSFKNGINKAKDDFGHGSPFVNLMDVFGYSKIPAGTTLGLVKTSPEERSLYSLKRGDILFVRSSVKPEGVGLTTLVPRDMDDTVFSGFLIRYRVEGQLSHEFMEHCFFSQTFRNHLIANSTVSANTNINQDALKRLKLRFPPNKTEQLAIARVLSDMDAEIAALEARLEKTRALKQGMMQELLTGRTRLV